MCVYVSSESLTSSHRAMFPRLSSSFLVHFIVYSAVIKIATMRRCATNKKLISYRHPSTFAPELIQSLIGEQATQLYSYKRKLHQEIPITFHGNCRLTLVLRFLHLSTCYFLSSTRLPRCYSPSFFFLFSSSGFPFQFSFLLLAFAASFNFTCPFCIRVISLARKMKATFIARRK